MMKKVFFLVIALMGCSLSVMADCPPSAKVTATVTLKRLPTGALPGIFTVSQDEKTVVFSKGNLQARTTDNGTNWFWKFAEKQYDYFGAKEQRTFRPATNSDYIVNGNLKISGAGITSESECTVDLFGWVGNSYTGTNNGAIHGINKAGNGAEYGNVPGEALKDDWGNCVIVNGGNAANSGWRSLTSAEWGFILGTSGNVRMNHNKVTGTVNGRAHASFTFAKILTDVTTGEDLYDKNIPGIILFPDAFDGSATYSGVTWGTINGASAWTTTCTSAGWQALEDAGCVFLPAAGRRSGASVSNPGSRGFYWSSTVRNAYYAYYLNFFSSSLNPQNNEYRNFGYSVRLVQDF